MQRIMLFMKMYIRDWNELFHETWKSIGKLHYTLCNIARIVTISVGPQRKLNKMCWYICTRQRPICGTFLKDTMSGWWHRKHFVALCVGDDIWCCWTWSISIPVMGLLLMSRYHHDKQSERITQMSANINHRSSITKMRLKLKYCKYGPQFSGCSDFQSYCEGRDARQIDAHHVSKW